MAKGSKVVEVAQDINAVNDNYASAFISFIQEGLSTETSIWEEMTSDHLIGLISVRGMKATIEKVNAEAGALPSIASSGAQYFADTVKVRNLQGGKDVPLKVAINVTTQGVRKLGKEAFLEAVGKASTFSALASKVEKAPAKEKADRTNTPKVDIADLDGLITFALGAIKGFQEGDDAGDLLAIKKVADAESLVTSLQFFIRSAKAVQALTSEVDASIVRHPANAKVKA